MRRGLALAIVTTLLGAAAGAAEEPVALGPCGPLARRHDAVEVPGTELRRLRGTPLAQLGVLAFRRGHPAPIPFQVDEREGRRIEFPEGPEATADDTPGAMDGQDLLVFMPCDAGERAAPEAVAAAAPGATAWREVRTTDPRNGSVGWVYVVVAAHPPTTDRRYVVYDAARDAIRTARYEVGLANALPVHLTIGMHGAPSPNLLDGFRLRAEATLRGSLAHWTLNEQQGRHALIAWRAGPVRVARRSRHWVRLPLNIEISAGLAHTYFHAEHVWGPGSMKLPFSPGVFFRDIRAFGGADARDLQGWRYHATGTPPEGFRIDGRTDDGERSFAGRGDWFALAGRPGTLLFVTRMSENLRRAVPLALVYRDDAARAWPPETVPGQVPLVGYEATGIQRLPGGRYGFSLHILALDRWRAGDDRAAIAALDTPLVAEMTHAWPQLPRRSETPSRAGRRASVKR